MEKGVLKLSKSNKGKIIVTLDRLNGRPPMPLAYVSLSSLEFNDKECHYEMIGGKVTKIEVEGTMIYGGSASAQVSQSNHPVNIDNNGMHRIYQFRDALNVEESKLPRVIRKLGYFDIENFSLKYNKAARYIEDAPGKNKFFFFKNDYRTYRDGRPPTGHEFFIHPNYGNLKFESIAKRQEVQVKTLFPAKKSEVIKIAPDWRLICGLSGGIYETNITLHHVYGVPYIPASSIKGVVRSWIITRVFGEEVPVEEKDYPMVNAEYRALKNSKLFCDLFGAPESIERVVFSNGKPEKKKDKTGKETEEYVTEKKEKSAVGKESQGKVVFFEGLPITPPKLMPDVINVHYPEWYKPEGYSPPTDYQSPIPVMFLTVTSESQFQTALGSHSNNSLSNWEDYKTLAKPVGLDGNATIIELAKKWLNLALSEHGIGAKTAVGYGYFKPAEP